MPGIKILGDSPTTEDGLGFDSYVNILLESINNFDAGSPLTIGIHGRWGSGKTSLMRMLEKRFEDDDNVKTIWFNAWAYGKEEAIGLALLQQVLIEFQREGKTEKIIELGKSLGKLFADAVLKKTTGLSFEEAKEIIKDSVEVKSTLRTDFKDAIDECLQDKRLVVFIDDLDRCLPEKTIDIFEVIKLFLDVPKCVFVIGVEKEVIERGIEIRYKSKELDIPISGKDYIEKIIQVPFTLPPIRKEDMTRFIESLGIGEKEKEYAEIVAKGTGCNPRKVKMFLNTLRIRQTIAERAGEGIKPDLSAKLFVIEYTFPGFYEDAVKYREQDFLYKLERLAKGEIDEKLEKELEGSETMQKYFKNEDLKRILKDEPFFSGIDIEPYIYLSGIKEPEKPLVFDESVLDELLSGDSVRIYEAAGAFNRMAESERHRYLDRILSLLNDKNLEVRWKATLSLGEIGDAKAIEPLIKVLKDENAYVREKAALSLRKIGDTRAIKPLIEALKDENAMVRRNAAEFLINIGDVKAIEPLIEALKDENTEVQSTASWALGRIVDARAIEPLVEALKDENGEVRGKAAVSLGNIGDARAIKPLVIALKDEDADVRGKAAGSLGNIGDARAIKPLVKALKDEDADVRWIAAGSLGNIGDARAIEPLVEALKDENGEVRWIAAGSLGRIVDARAIEPLVEALKDENGEVRWNAAWYLAHIGDARAIKPLIEALKDENADVRWKTAGSLGRIGDARAIKPLIKALKDENAMVRRNAAESLGNIGDARAIEPLIKVLKDEDAKVRWKAAGSLGEIGDARAIEPLKEVLKDKNEYYQYHAKSALKKIKVKQKSK